MIHFDELTQEEQREFAREMGEFYLDGLKRNISMVRTSIIEAWEERNQRGERRDAWNNRSDLE